MAQVFSLYSALLAEREGSLADLLKAETSTRITPLRRKSFRHANLRGKDLEGARICASSDASSQRRSDFMGADFSNSNLKNAQFCGLDLRAADFSDCNLQGASFVMCDLDGSKFHRVAMHEHTENKTGYYPSVMNCTIRHMKAVGADFTGAMFILPGPGSQHMSANMARFEDCEFDRVNFSGDWTNATFLKCDLSNSYPGSYVKGGARWDVAISHDSNIDGMLTKNCDRQHNIIPEGSVEVPDEAWDEDGFEVSPNDGFQVKADLARSVKRAAARAYAEAMAAKIMAQDAKAKAKAKKIRLDRKAKARKNWLAEKARAKKARLAREQAYAQQVQAAEQERISREVEVAKQVVTMPPLTGSFITTLGPYNIGPFKVRVAFNRPLSTGYATVRDQGFMVSGARVTSARRVNRRSDLWELTLVPHKSIPMSISISSTGYLKDKGKRSVSPFSVTVQVG